MAGALGQVCCVASCASVFFPLSGLAPHMRRHRQCRIAPGVVTWQPCFVFVLVRLCRYVPVRMATGVHTRKRVQTCGYIRACPCECSTSDL